MSETDKYVGAAHELWALANAGLYEGIEDAADRIAAYLREHFVTREEYDGACRDIDSLRDGINGFAEEIVALTAGRDRLRAALEGIKQIVQRRQLPITHQVYDAVQAALNPEDV